MCTCDCRRLGVAGVVSSKYDDLVFVVMVRIYLYLSDSNEQNIYDQRQYIKSIVSVCCITEVKCILVTIIISNV